MHVLVCGKTGSGKTTLARQLAAAYHRPVIVLDKMRDVWPTPYVYVDPTQFCDAVRKARECMVFIDESGAEVGRYNDEMFWLATEARHYGHVTHFVTQRPSQLNPTVRTQCSRAFVFAVAPSDAKRLADEMVAPGLLAAPELPLLHYLAVRPDGKVSRGVVNPQSLARVS